jgi:hypothetical protein
MVTVWPSPHLGSNNGAARCEGKNSSRRNYWHDELNGERAVATKTAGVQNRATATEKEENNLAGVGAVIECERCLSRLANAARTLLTVAACPKQQNAEKTHVGGEATKQTSCWHRTIAN